MNAGYAVSCESWPRPVQLSGACGVLCGEVMQLAFELGDAGFRHPLVTGAVLVAAAGLMVSRIPTYSLKKFKVRNVWVLPMMLLIGLFAAGIVVMPWLTLALIGITYIASLPFGVLSYRRLERMATELQNAPSPAPPDAPSAGTTPTP